MKAFKKLIIGILLYVVIPAAVLNMIIDFTDRESDRLAYAMTFVRDVFYPAPEKSEVKTSTPVLNSTQDAHRATPSAPVNYNIDPTHLPVEFADQSLSVDDILQDRLNLIPEDFKISAELKPRVHFWFDVYTKYSSRFTLIHDYEHPWIIYRVVDSRSVWAGKGSRFQKAVKERNMIAKAKNEVRGNLLALSRKKDFRSLNSEQYKFLKLLESVPGKNRRSVYKTAAQSVREQLGQKNYFRTGLIESSKYISEMEQIFAHNDLPVELVRLPLVESSFNAEAESKVGATGIWQFMQDTGKKFLRVGHFSDERQSPIKATHAAAALMQSNYKILKSWPLAVSAYNHGAGGLIRASKKFKTKDLSIIIDKYESGSFSFASKNFYCEFLGALFAEKYQREIFGDMPRHEPIVGETTTLRTSMKAETLIQIAGITMEELKLYNLDLKAQAIAGKTYLPVGYQARLPIGLTSRLELFYQQADEAKTLVKKIGTAEKTPAKSLGM